MKQRIVLHIGFPKTGTTSIQVFCATRRQELGRAGVDYPVLGVPDGTGEPKANHNAFSTALLLRPPPRLAPHREPSIRQTEAVFARFRAGGRATLLLSDETVAQRNDLDHARLAAWLGDTDTTVLVFVRLFDEWLESLYAQNLRSGRVEVQPFRRSRLGQQPERAGFLPRLRALRRGLPAANFAARSFDRCQGTAGGLVGEALRSAGVTDPALLAAAGDGARVNAARPTVAVLFGAYLAIGLDDPAMVRAAVAALQQGWRAGATAELDDVRFGLMPVDLKRHARALYRRDLPALRDEFGLVADDPGPVTDAEAAYRSSLSSDEFHRLLAVAAPHLPGLSPTAAAAAYERAAAAMNA